MFRSHSGAYQDHAEWSKAKSAVLDCEGADDAEDDEDKKNAVVDYVRDMPEGPEQQKAQDAVAAIFRSDKVLRERHSADFYEPVYEKSATACKCTSSHDTPLDKEAFEQIEHQVYFVEGHKFGFLAGQKCKACTIVIGTNECKPTNNCPVFVCRTLMKAKKREELPGCFSSGAYCNKCALETVATTTSRRRR